jgi:Na+-driven multidrug efflux pump
LNKLPLSDNRRQLILEGGLWRAIIALTLPNIAVGFIQAITPFIDSLFIYNTVGDGAGAAVTFAGPVLNLVQAFGAGLGVAGLAVIGRSNGSGDLVRTRLLAGRFLKIVLATGAVASLVMLAISTAAVSSLPPKLIGQAAGYLQLSAVGVTFSYFGAAYNAIAMAYGRAEKTLYITGLSLGLKVGGDLLFVVLLRGGVLGAAWSSVAAAAGAAAVMTWDLLRATQAQPAVAERLALPEPASGLSPAVPIPKLPLFIFALFRMGIPAALVQASNSLSFYIMNQAAAHYGTTVLNGFGIANTVNAVFFSPVAAIGSAVAAAAAITSGAKVFERGKQLAKAGLWMSAGLSLVFTVILFPSSELVVSAFSRSPEVVRHAAEAMRVFSASIIGFALFNVVSGTFAGTGRTGVPLSIAVLRIWILRIPVVLVLAWLWPGLKEQAVWISMAASNVGTALVALILFWRMRWDRQTSNTLAFEIGRESLS